MLEDLEEITVDRPKSLGPIYWNYNRDEIQMQIAKLRASLPLEVKQAANLTRESERVIEQAREDAGKTMESAQKEVERTIEDARNEAERLINQAKLEQERLLSEHEILKLAKSQGEEIRQSADKEASLMRRGAEDYAFTVLSQLESVVGKAMTAIDRGKAELKPSNDLAAIQPRERAKVAP